MACRVPAAQCAMVERKGPGAAWLVAAVVLTALAAGAVVASALCYLQMAALTTNLDRLNSRVEELERQLLNVNKTVAHWPAEARQGDDTDQVYEYDDGESSYEDEEDVELDEEERHIAKRTTEAVDKYGRLRRQIQESGQVSLLEEFTSQEIKPNHHRIHHEAPENQKRRRQEEPMERIRHEGRHKSNLRRDMEHSARSREEWGSEVAAAHYVGNNRVHHPENGHSHIWYPASWMSGSETNFKMGSDGNLTVHTAGLYFIYAQIYYVTPHDFSGFHIKLNGEDVAQCIITSHSSIRDTKRNTCFTGFVFQLKPNDHLSTREMEGGRNTSFRNHHSFFGLILLKPT